MTHTRNPFVLLVLWIVTSSFAAGAEPIVPNQPRHIRTNEPRLLRLVHDGIRSSETFRRLVERLQQSDVVVYLETAAAGASDGRLIFMSSVGGLRYVQVRMIRLVSPDGQIALIGHELQHAVEIADAPDVVDSASMARAYERIGFQNPRASAGMAFDSDAAIEAGHRVLRELSAKTIAKVPTNLPLLTATY